MASVAINISAARAVGLLKPILRLFVKSSMRFQEITEIVKIALVELAQEEISSSSTKINSSRISIISGVHRRDVTRIRSKEERKEFTRGGTVARVLSRWANDKRFTTKGGRPRTLSYEGDESEFAKLVRQESTDLNPGTVLFELLRVGAAEKTSQGLKFSQVVFSTPENMDDGWGLLAKDSELLVRAVAENLCSPDELVNHHLSTDFDNIFVKDVKKVREWLASQGKAFHKRARNFLANHDKDLATNKSHEGGVKVSFCSFSVVELPNKSSE